MAISWVAEQNATAIESNATVVSVEPGSTPAIPNNPAAIPSWAISIQLLRRPRARVISGNGRRSTSGAQKNLIEYRSPTHANIPMADFSTSYVRSHAVKVVNTSGNGNPAANPRNSIPMTRGLR